MNAKYNQIDIKEGRARAHKAGDTLVWLYGIVVEKHIDDEPDLSYLEDTDGKSEEDIAEDKKRLRDYGTTWWTCGIKASAQIYTSQNGREWLINEVSSGGLWGIEDDSPKEHFESVARQELANLRTVLLALGFSAEEIDREENTFSWRRML